jgi:hypothetical protein
MGDGAGYRRLGEVGGAAGGRRGAGELLAGDSRHRRVPAAAKRVCRHLADRAGKPVPRQVLVSYVGARHCDWESVTFLWLAWPSGRVAASDQAGNVRLYLRDPNGVLGHLSARGGFGRGWVPTDARDTGYRHGAYQLWVSSSDADRFVYVASPGGVERWPRATRLIACF